MNKKQKEKLFRIVITAAAMAILYFLPVTGAVQFLLYFAVYLLIGYDILIKAVKGICNLQPFDENFLMAVASIGAISLALASNEEYTEAVMIMLFYQIGEWFQSYAIGKSRRNISELMDIRPDYANIEKDGSLIRVDPQEVAPGSIITVQPGEKIPIDGLIVEGDSTIDTSALTGESLPRSAAMGDDVISGCINLSGLIKVKTTKEFDDSTVSKILELTENASFNKAKAEDFITKFARIYTPAVCISALVLAVLPPLINIFILGMYGNWSEWIYRALTFLVISCPCALVISIPLSFFAGIGGASRNGILIKGANYMEALARINCVIFDKTGTLSQGVFEVDDIHHSTLDRQTILKYAAFAESSSLHPISHSLQKAYGGEIDRNRVKDINEISGKGVTAIVDGHDVAAGNSKLMEYLNIPYKNCHSPGTIVHMAIDGQYSGHIVISDALKPSSCTAIQKLQKYRVKRILMLTGDSESAAKSAAERLGISEYFSNLLPGDKVQKVESILEEKSGVTAFAGDGINDAPVLARADVGIAMGAMGSDAAIEAADIVLMDDDPVKICTAIHIARKCMRIVYENIYFAIGVKILCLILGAAGQVHMLLAIFADVGVMVIAVLNSMSLLTEL